MELCAFWRESCGIACGLPVASQHLIENRGL